MTLLAPSGSALGGAGGAEPESIRLSTLPSGLRVVTEWLPGVRSASVGVWIGAGARDEAEPEAGAAHYLEHLLFKGTRRRTAAQIAEEIDAVGGELNAFTAKEHTCFYANVLDADLPLAVDLLADVVTEATMTPADVRLERAVVLEEIAMRADDPEDLLGELFERTLFPQHPLGRPVIGTQASIEAMTRDRLRQFWRRHYTQPKMVVAAAGNVRHETVLDLVQAAFHIDAAPAARPAPPRRGVAPRPGAEAGTARLALEHTDTEQAHLMLGMPGLNRWDERRVALEVLSTALGGGMSSRLFQQVREQRGLAYSVYASATSYSDAGQLAIYAGCQPDRLGEVASVVRQVLAAVAEDGLTEAEVARAKGALRGGLVLGLEDTVSRMHRIGSHELELGRQRSLAHSLAEIEAVTSEQVASVAAEILRAPPSAAVVGPFSSARELPAPLTELVR